MWTEHRFISWDKTPIFYRRRAADAPKAVVIMVHGMGEHGGRYHHVAEYFAAAGLESILPDIRGFGRSGGPRTSLRSFSDLHQDLGALHSYVARTHRPIPIFLMGHSFGGLLVASYLAFSPQAPSRGLVLSSPCFGIAIQVSALKTFFAVAISYLFPNYREPDRIDPRLLTHDSRLLSIYEKDSLVDHRISVSLYRELVLMPKKKFEIAKRLKLPVLIEQAGEDFIVSTEETRRFYEALSSPDKQKDIYDGFYHEILNETGRSKVLARMTGWMLEKANSNAL